MWPNIQEQVAIERANIDQLFVAYTAVIHKAAHIKPDLIEQSALSTMLHSFYNGIESTFKQVDEVNE